MLELDHIFIATSPGAPALDKLLDLGLCEGSRNVHPGQGTANRRVFFHNAMLEWLWLTDADEAQSDPIRRTGLYARLAADRGRDASPFGICLRATDANDALPFETWPYQPPYLPPDLSIPMSVNSHHANEPLIFAIPFGGRPDQYPADRREPLDHPVGWREITAVCVTVARPGPLSASLLSLNRIDGIAVQSGTKHHLEIEFDGGAEGREISLSPLLPLLLRW